MNNLLSYGARYLSNGPIDWALGAGWRRVLGGLHMRASGMITNWLEKVLLHDLKNERGNKLSDTHTSDLGLHGELADHFLVQR